MTEWVSHATAAELVGCSANTIEQHLDEIVHRPRKGGRPSLDRASVEEWGEAWRTTRTAMNPRREPADESAPNDGEVWLDATTAGLVLGCSSQYVNRLAVQERIPATRRGRRWWLRRWDVESYAAARAFAAMRRAGCC